MMGKMASAPSEEVGRKAKSPRTNLWSCFPRVIWDNLMLFQLGLFFDHDRLIL
jgi:hypothetical protein